MPQDREELRVGANGDVYLAAKGTTLPTDIDGTITGFVPLGFLTEDGVTLTLTASFTDKKAWQSLYTLRKIATSRDFTVDFTLEQWNEVNVELAMNGTLSTTSNGTKLTPNDASTIVEKAAIIKWIDGANTFMLVIPVCTPSTDSTAIKLTRADTADLPIQLTVTPDGVQNPWYLLTDDPDLTATSS